MTRAVRPTADADCNRSVRQVALTVVFALALLQSSGCAITYRNAETGAVHLWGFGHLSMRATVPEGDKKAVIQGASTAGVSAGTWNGSVFLTAGWNRHQTVEIIDPDTYVRIEAPDNDLLNLNISGQSNERESTGEGEK